MSVKMTNRQIGTPNHDSGHEVDGRCLQALARAGFVVALVFGLAIRAPAQYPNVPRAVQAEARARQAAADKRSDEAFARALPVIKEWEAKGKPYLPGAAKPGDLPRAKIPAFPGAWGGGMYSFGGRGGKVFVVTNLNDSGPGSFREACEAGGPRIVIFNVAGIIHLKDRLRIRAPYITIAGNTAPGDGVCIAGNTVELENHDVIVRWRQPDREHHDRSRFGELGPGRKHVHVPAHVSTAIRRQGTEAAHR
jgi:hypothetical protein